jgi:hypothetical protein
MPSYPLTIRRCQHIKVNGTQCGSPALRDEKYCFFHLQWQQKTREINLHARQEPWKVKLPVLEDANSVQMVLVEVMGLLMAQQIDHRTAALLLYALQTASANVKRTSFEPEQPTHVVIDRECVERRPIGATAWSAVEGREYDDVENDDVKKDESEQKEGDFEADLMRLIAGQALDPEFLDRRRVGLRSKQEKEVSKS